MQQLLNLVISALLPPAPVPHTPNTLSPMEALIPSTSPLQEQPRGHHRHWGCSFSPLLKSASFPSLQRWPRKLDEPSVWSRKWRKYFLLDLEEPLQKQWFFHEERVPGASFWCGWSYSLLIRVAELWADVNHTTSSCLYSLQDVKLEIAQSSQEIIW